MRRTGAVVAAVASAGLAGCLAAAIPASGLAHCQGITISGALSLTVSSAAVPKGGCVQFANDTNVKVTITVRGTSYDQQLAAKASSGGATANFVANTTGQFTVAVTDGLRSGRGTITVTAPTPTPTRAPTSRAPATPSPTVAASSHSASATPHRSHHPAAAGHRPGSAPSPGALPPLTVLPTGSAASTVTGASPKVAPGLPRPSALAAAPGGPSGLSGPLEPMTGEGHGLPAAVAALLVLGVAAAIGRVLVAQPIDEPRARRLAVDSGPAPRRRI